MNEPYWLTQTTKPLFPDILWSRPESRHGAGKLLLIGGNKFGFAAPATAYSQALAAGVGVVRVLLPESLHQLVGGMVDAVFAPNNPSGSFSKQATQEMLIHAAWADAVLLAGELGRNSETAVTLEGFTKKYVGPLVITRDAADYFLQTPHDILQRPQSALVISFEQLQKIGIHSKHTQPLLFSMNLPSVVQWLHEFTLTNKATIVTLHNASLFVAHGGKVVTQAHDTNIKTWRVTTAAKAAVFWLQNPSKPLEAIASSFITT